MDLSDVYHGYMADPAFKHLRGSHFVPGDGNPNARVMFVGEAPGYMEDKRRLPFQGLSGRILDREFERVGIKRDEVFITNLLKYRPPQNRDPLPLEVQESILYLGEEIRCVKPQWVVCMGKFPTRAFFPGRPFKDLVGSNHFLTDNVSCFVTYHPAVISYNPELKPMFQRHFDLLADLLRGMLDDGRSDRHPTTG